MRMNLQDIIRCNVSKTYIYKSLLVCNHLITVIVVNNNVGPNRPFKHQYNIKQILLTTPTQARPEKFRAHVQKFFEGPKITK